MIDNNTLEISNTRYHIVILAYSFIIVFSVSHRPIQRRAAAYNVETSILDFIGAYTWQETLLLLVLLLDIDDDGKATKGLKVSPRA